MLLARTMLVEFCNLYRGYSQERLDYMLLSFPSPSPAVMFENRISLAPAASFSTNAEWDGYKGNSIKNILLGGTFIDESWGPPRVCLSEPLPAWCQKHGRTTDGFFLGLIYRRQHQKHQIWSLPGIGIGQSLLMDMSRIIKGLREADKLDHIIPNIKYCPAQLNDFNYWYNSESNEAIWWGDGIAQG